jgi:hypothetical protein
MAAGCRVRLLLEWYDPDLTEPTGQEMLAEATAKVTHLFPGVVLQGYVEPNPPADEIPAR